MESYYVYQHTNLENDTPFYIGVGTNDKYKYYSRSKAKKKRSKQWKDYVHNINNNYKITILLESNNYYIVSKKEIEFISLYGRIDKGTGTLVNLNDGGRGSKGISKESFTNMLKKQKCKRVVAYALNGDKIDSYDRKRSAATALNIPYGSVDQSLKANGRQASGYRFLYEIDAPDKLDPIKLWKINRNVKLICNDVTTNETIIFDSMKDAVKELHIPAGTIGNNLKGITSLAKKKYRFRYETTEDFINKPKFIRKKSEKIKVIRKVIIKPTKKVVIKTYTHIHMYDFYGNFVRSFHSISTAAKYLNVSPATIRCCLDRIQYQTKGYQFNYEFVESLPKVLYKIGKDKKMLFKDIHTNEEFIFNSIIEASEKLSISIASIRHFLYKESKAMKRKYICEYIN